MGFALRYWRYIAIGLLAALLATQTLRLGHAKGDLATARAALKDPTTGQKWETLYQFAAANLTTCKANRDTYKAESDRQGAAALEMGRLVEAKTAENAKALAAGRKQGMKSQAEADRILGIRVTGADQCARMLDAERQIDGDH